MGQAERCTTCVNPARSRRTVHVVPGSSERFLARAAGLDADELVLDLEDAVAPAEKERARALVVTALRDLDAAREDPLREGQRDRQRRTATATSSRSPRASGDRVDTILLPKVRSIRDIAMADLLLDGIELANGLEPGRIGLEAQIEDAQGLVNCEAIASSSRRMEALHFGPGDFSASVGIPTTTIGGTPEGYPGDHLNHVYLRIVVAARAAGHPGDRRALRRPGRRRGPPRPARGWPAPSASTASGPSTRPRSRPSTRSSRRPTQELERAEALLAAYREASDGGAAAPRASRARWSTRRAARWPSGSCAPAALPGLRRLRTRRMADARDARTSAGGWGMMSGSGSYRHFRGET